METCLLCLEGNNESEECIKVNSSQWQELDIDAIIEKHLWPMQTMQHSSWLCTTCWKELNSFHKFYTRIEDAHMQLDSMVKAKNSNDSNIIPEVCMPETALEKVDIEQPNIIIKHEPDTEDLWVNDDIPLIEIRKNIQKTTIPVETSVEDPLKTSLKCKQKKLPLKTKAKKKESSLKSKERASKKVKTKKQHVEKQSQIKQEANSVETNDEESYDSDSNNETDNKTNTPTTKDKEKDKFITENFKLICILCDIPMETFQTLLIHFKVEHKERGYVICCNKKFFRRYILLDHLHQHLDPNYLRCKICNKVFGYRRILKIHGKVHDPKFRNRYCCDICGLSFHTSVVLNNHKTTHLTEEEKTFPCPECDKKFGGKWVRDNHIRKVHGSRLNCDICGQFLVNKSVLNRHKILKHPVDGPKEYKCTICSKLLTSQYGLNNHIRYAHKMGHNHKCTICDRAFKRKRNLLEHLATHSDTRLYSCPWCPKTSNSHSNIASHRKKFHPKEEENRKNNSANLLNVSTLSSSINLANE